MQKRMLETIGKLSSFMHSRNYASYDWWDLWSSKIGSWSKSLYHKNNLIGLPFVVALQFFDLLFPQFRKYYASEKIYPIVLAHSGLANLNLYDYSGDKKYLLYSIELGELLYKEATVTLNGIGWGMKHDWITINGLIPSGTPCNTQTAYAYELFLKLFLITNEDKYKHYLDKIANHIYSDFNETINNAIVNCSYSTLDHRRVINANSYRMFMLLEYGTRFNKSKFYTKGIGTLNYLKSMQNPDGSWPYSEEQHFVDHYHTCFVLKNLLKVKGIIGQQFLDYNEMLDKGVKYYLNSLFYVNQLPKPFTVKPRSTLFKYDCYDVAESLNLLLDIENQESKVENILEFALSKMQASGGWFKFRIYKFPVAFQIPYMRYANSAMFMALTKWLKYHPYAKTA